ncbi:hypothetical protein BJY01DRAFT_249609 [Aspergillus pseudoustus]|uniref:Nascent polypeptide-associated complex subunit alpha-like UBA domain-containing protein n=1 Tax=Aspergillus pseudoustus TaxID=1810923 RepID=A0ABR4JMM7_9EURO
MSDPLPSEHHPASTSAEDRKAAAALSSLNTTEITSDSASGTGAAKPPSAADQEALGKAMSRLEIASGGGGAANKGKKKDDGAAKGKGGGETAAKKKPAVPAVKVSLEDVGLLVNELDLNKVKATELLKANGGDAKRAIRAFIRSNSRAAVEA